jgi:hypothetical protein
VNPEVRLAEIVTAIEATGIPCLVMGGHAVRYYGLSRNTIDFDLHIVEQALASTSLAVCQAFLLPFASGLIKLPGLSTHQRVELERL